MNTLVAGVEKINSVLDDKLRTTLGENRYMQYKSISSNYQRVEFLFNELLRIVGVNDTNKAEHTDLLNTINSAITLIVSRNTDALITYDVFQYILAIRDACSKLLNKKEDAERLTKAIVVLFEIVRLT
jgi:hypothetical protein